MEDVLETRDRDDPWTKETKTSKSGGLESTFCTHNRPTTASPYKPPTLLQRRPPDSIPPSVPTSPSPSRFDRPPPQGCSSVVIKIKAPTQSGCGATNISLRVKAANDSLITHQRPGHNASHCFPIREDQRRDVINHTARLGRSQRIHSFTPTGNRR